MQTTSSSSQHLKQQVDEKQDVSHIKNIVEDESLTFAEKIISIKNVETHNKKSKIKSVSGDIVVVDVDLALAQDSTGPLAPRSFKGAASYRPYISCSRRKSSEFTCPDEGLCLKTQLHVSGGLDLPSTHP
jgi:hypothetical protein